MIEINITEKDLNNFLNEQKEKIPVFAFLWEAYIPTNQEKKVYFEFYSKKHYSNQLVPENFYKPTVSIVNINENEELQEV